MGDKGAARKEKLKRTGDKGATPSNDASSKEHERAHELERRLNVNERLTLLVGVGSLLVAGVSAAISYFSYEVSKDTADIKQAISALAQLATESSLQTDQSSRQTHQLSQQAKETARQANALIEQLKQLKIQADATQALIEPARRSADAAVTSVQQQIENFLIDQRPVIRIGEGDESKGLPPFHDYSINKELHYWNYSITNIGKSVALNVKQINDLSIGGKPFHRRNVRRGVDIMPGEVQFSTATAEFPYDNIDDTPIIMRIMIEYNDVRGLTYRQKYCAMEDMDGTIYICIYDEMDKLGVGKEVDF